MSGPRKLKCQSSGLFRISSHGPMPGNGASMIDPFADAIRILRGERVADHVADIMGDKIGLLDVELVQHGRDVDALRFLVVAGVRDTTKPMPRRSGTITV